MSNDLNQISIIGRLVREPEIRYIANGTPITKFSIANNTVFMQNNEKKEMVNYFDIIVWGNQAINCEKYLKKGSQVAIVGSLRQNRWTDKTSGQNRSKVEITANVVQFLTKNENNPNAQQQQNAVNQIFNDPFQEDADIKF